MPRMPVLLLLMLALPCVADEAGPPDEYRLEAGFTSLFDGESLDGWRGDPQFWSVKDGAIHGQTTKDKRTRGNTFIVKQDLVLKDFDLRLHYRITTGNNSGVQYRSVEFKPYRIRGYQGEVENNLGDQGFLYHEKGRGRIVNVPDFVVIDEKGKKQTVGKVNDLERLRAIKYHKMNAWNEYRIVARGNHIVHYVNGHQTIELIDRDRKGRHMEGVLALQLHAGSPMTVEFRHIRVKPYDQPFGEAKRIFNGKDLTGWQAQPKATLAKWKVDDGTLIVPDDVVSSLRPASLPKHYVLRMQYLPKPTEAEPEPAWRDGELWVTEGAVHLVADGEIEELRADGFTTELLTEGQAAAYRNIVLIPIVDADADAGPTTQPAAD